MERTKRDYRKHIAAIDKEFGDLPLVALDDPRTRGIFKKHRAMLAKSSLRQADYWWSTLARVLSVATDHGKIRTNPCEKGGASTAARVDGPTARGFAPAHVGGLQRQVHSAAPVQDTGPGYYPRRQAVAGGPRRREEDAQGRAHTDHDR